MIRLGFATNTSIATVPSITVYLDHSVLVKDHALIDAGKVDDPMAQLHWVDIPLVIPDGDHKLEIRAANIDNQYKENGDFGFQLRSIFINKTNLAWFDIPFRSVNPVTMDYIDSYIKSNNLQHEIIGNDHVREGAAANYVNFPNGYISLEFSTPLYYWFLSKKFDKLNRIILLRRHVVYDEIDQ
jgi:hypothetical protein